MMPDALALLAVTQRLRAICDDAGFAGTHTVPEAAQEIVRQRDEARTDLAELRTENERLRELVKVERRINTGHVDDIIELRETITMVDGERDSLQLRVQQLDADEDRLDWLDQCARSETWHALQAEHENRGDLREAIDKLRGAKP